MQKQIRKFASTAALALATSFIFSACKKDEPEMLACVDITSPKTLSNHNSDGVDYTVGCNLYVYSKLTIEAGTLIEFSQGGAIIVEQGGSIEIKGTASDHVVLRAENNSSQRGIWAGIIIYSNDVNNRIEYADISGAGGEEFNSNGDLGNLVIYNGAKASISNTSFSNSQAYGLNVLGDADVSLSSLSFKGNQKPIILPMNQAHRLDASTTYTDNDNQYVEVSVGDITENVTWKSLPVPYFITPTTHGIFQVSNVIDNGSLTVEAGSQIQFAANCGLATSGSAYTSFQGTSSQHIVLRGLTNTPGSWRGVYFESNNTQNSLNYVDISGAGSDAFNSNGNVAAIVAFANSALTVQNSNISNSLTCGIYIGDNVNFSESNNSFSNVPSNTCTD